MQELKGLAALSRVFGADPEYVFLGGGNTSLKTDSTLYIKPSGAALATIRAQDFLAVDRAAARRVFSDTLPADVWEREAAVKQLLLAAVRPPAGGRPSVETPVHEVFDFPYVFHLHPAFVNGMTCARQGAAVAAQLFPDALWVEFVKPGYSLARVMADRLRQAAAAGQVPNTVFLANHGVFIGADSPEQIRTRYEAMMQTLAQAYEARKVKTVWTKVTPDPDTVRAAAPVLRTLLKESPQRALVTASGWFEPAAGPLTPDHIVYAGSFPCRGPAAAAAVGEFRADHGGPPKVIAVPDRAVFCAGATLKAARETQVAARDAARVWHLAAAFGGPCPLDDDSRTFIENWEAEAYRSKVGMTTLESSSRLRNRVCLVTGAAQGFGLGIARGLLAEGGVVVMADINAAGVRDAATRLNADFGADRAVPLVFDIAGEESVAAAASELLHMTGGLDLLVANAGVLRAGPVATFALSDFNLVTAVNYTGYFLCVKHLSPIMAAQHIDGDPAWSDIIQINSKSGLEGSNRNAAYAGSKFGTLGLTQSFAKELVQDRIKVNSICPGNYFDGPLWSDPENGLFMQYLEANKVAGAATVSDVRKAYEDKVPMGRGCTPADVVRAILYLVEQEYETGQALPVTGGQVMLK